MRKKHSYYVYIITNPKKTVLYIGVTNNLGRRLVEHYAYRGTNKSFAGKYYAYNLIYCEHFKYITRAIAREKELKKWNRQRKETLIATKNPEWKFYNDFFCGEWPPQKIWGTYAENYRNKKNKQSKIALPKISKTVDTVCIYEDEVKLVAPISEKAVNSPMLQALETQFWNHPKLTKRELYLISISVLTAQGNKEELNSLVSSMPADLFSKEEIDALFLQISLYTGLPFAKAGKVVVDAALGKKDEPGN